jgi:hypothetical protein
MCRVSGVRKRTTSMWLCAVRKSVASVQNKGWFKNVKKWVNLHNVKKVGDHAGGTKYPQHFKMIIHKDY